MLRDMTFNPLVLDDFNLCCTVLETYSFSFQLGSRNSIDNVIENLLDSVGRENLQLLLTEDEVWKVFVAEAELSRSVLL
jgi:hypothetical protein